MVKVEVGDFEDLSDEGHLVVASRAAAVLLVEVELVISSNRIYFTKKYIIL